MATTNKNSKTNKRTNSKTASKKTTKTTRKPRPVYDFDINVTRVFDGRYGILFDMEINHVFINGCRVVSTEEGEAFIGFPQKKGKKDDKWWNVCYAPLTDEQTADILEQVENLLDADNDDGEEDEDE